MNRNDFFALVCDGETLDTDAVMAEYDRLCAELEAAKAGAEYTVEMNRILSNKLAAAEDRFFMKIGLEIAKTAYEKSGNEMLREALERFASIDLTLPLNPKIVFDILHARDVLKKAKPE